jgi:hypothetical protein
LAQSRALGREWALGFIVVEWIMLLGLGFLAGCLLMVTLIPAIHARAVRLTARRYQAATPASVAEVQAEKDLLRAQYAMMIRRMEIATEEAKAKAADALMETGRKSAEIHRLNAELAKATAAPDSLSSVLSLLRGRAA